MIKTVVINTDVSKYTLNSVIKERTGEHIDENIFIYYYIQLKKTLYQFDTILNDNIYYYYCSKFRKYKWCKLPFIFPNTNHM